MWVLAVGDSTTYTGGVEEFMRFCNQIEIVNKADLTEPPLLSTIYLSIKEKTSEGVIQVIASIE